MLQQWVQKLTINITSPQCERTKVSVNTEVFVASLFWFATIVRLSISATFHGVGVNPAKMQEAMQVPWAALQARTAAGTPAPAVRVPKVNPAAA